MAAAGGDDHSLLRTLPAPGVASALSMAEPCSGVAPRRPMAGDGSMLEAAQTAVEPEEAGVESTSWATLERMACTRRRDTWNCGVSMPSPLP